MPGAKGGDGRGIGLAAVLALGFVAAAYSQVKLQTVERQGTLKLAKAAHRYIQTVQERARRGSILAADGRPLAKDEDAYDLTVDFSACPHSPAFWLDVSAATGVAATELEEAAASGSERRAWVGAVAASERTQLAEVCAKWRADGVSAGWSGRRDYPLAEAASSLVGVIRPKGLAIKSDDHRWRSMVDEYGVPKKGYFLRDLVTGVEAGKNDELVGQNGEVEGLTDRHGLFMASRGSRTIHEREDGKDVRLTIVPELQVAATAAIRRQVEAVNAKSGVALIMDPKTGDLLAMANWPASAPYRPDGTENPLKDSSGGGNPCYMSVLEPGSMFKILTLAKCLDVAPAVAHSHIMCTSHWQVGKKVIGCDDGRAHGNVDARLAIAKSCNIAAGHWALAIGHDPFLEFLEDAGLRWRTKLGLPGESAALFPTSKDAPVLTTAVVGFGQSINCTPVQLIGAFSSIGNGGVRMEPRVFAKVGNADVPREAGKRLFSEAAAAETLSDMEAVMSPIGTGRSLQIPGYRLAGKSGTAQKLGKKQHGHVSNFIGFLPAQDPKVSILVMVNEPVGARYHGAALAGVAWKEIAEAVIQHDHIKPTEPIPATKRP